MKNIDKYINESLLTEAQGKIVAFFDHYDPTRTWLIIGADNKMTKRIPDGFDIFDIPKVTLLIKLFCSVIFLAFIGSNIFIKLAEDRLEAAIIPILKIN